MSRIARSIQWPGDGVFGLDGKFTAETQRRREDKRSDTKARRSTKRHEERIQNLFLFLSVSSCCFVTSCPCFLSAPPRLCGESFLLGRKRQHVDRRRSPALAVAVLNGHVHQLLSLVDRFDKS